jgi:cell division protein DivIC
MQLIDKIPPFLRNKYILVLIVAFVWFMFFDKNSFIQHFRISQQIKELRSEKEYYREQIILDSLEVEKLKNDPEELERYAREKYLMKKKDEDIFIVNEE